SDLRAAVTGDAPLATAAGASTPTPSASGASLPRELRAEFGAFYAGHAERYASITCLGASREPLFRVAGLVRHADGSAEADIRTRDLPPTGADGRVWGVASASEVLRSPVTHQAGGATMRFTVPVFLEVGDSAPRGALVVEMKLDPAFRTAGAVESEPSEATRRGAARHVLALDQDGRILFHTDEALREQPVEQAMPFFRPVAERMKMGASGMDFYEDRATDGDRWLAAYRPVRGSNLSVAVAGNYTQAVGGLKRAGLSGVALLLLAALVATALLVFVVGKTAHRIERVSSAASAVASGDLNQRVEIRTHDETRVLADSFNRMTDRLRGLISKEAESRQFQSFMRLSAILTHDLKNAITGLSILVANMEKQFHREEFRADAIHSLRESTEKLKRIVARLSEPMKSLSGEYRRDSRPLDLVPVIRRVLAQTAEPSAPLYDIRTRLPETLVAYAEPTRIENVVENLVLNALEAMGAKGGRLTVEAGEEANGMVYFSVADTGTGMSEEFIKMHLYRAFTTTKSQGIGLGLYTCREIVEAHGGRLDVESKVGAGTRFRVVLPSKPLTLRDHFQQSQRSGARDAKPGAGVAGRRA
ncbi:MAG TPA: ATP-binding protein, partial [Pyrinomonadaceae bacterium]|nr:ATP-binding protein [Pyrinomonadaceae bacterium]